MLRIARFAVISLVALAVTGSVQAGSAAAPAAPKGLKAFLLRADEPAKHEFSRTPAFSWAPVRGAIRYEFELSKNQNFTEAGIFWSDEKLKAPAVSVPVALPWLTGNPYAVYARVRAITAAGVTGWSKPYGFNIRWSNLPQQLPSDPGMSRWTVVQGASSYQVWFVDVFPGKVIATKTNAVDHREFYAFHQQAQYSGTVRFRVRAVRNLYGSIPTGLPAVSHGPWSPILVSSNPAINGGVVAPTATRSDTTSSTAASPRLHRLTPGFAFNGTTAGSGTPYELYRVYVFSDRDCVNTIFRGAMVASPAYVPRLTGPLNLPKSDMELTTARTQILRDGPEPSSFTVDGLSIQSTEQDKPAAVPAPAAPAPATGSEGQPVDPAGTPPAADLNLPATPVLSGAPVDLWESGWPNGRFYWTVVPIKYLVANALPVSLSAPAAVGATTLTVDSSGFPSGTAVIGAGATSEAIIVSLTSGATLQLQAPLTSAHPAGAVVTPTAGSLKYYDVESPQDACAAGRRLEFGKTSEPAVSRSGSPFVSGLSPRGRLTAAAKTRPSFYGSPLVAWEPALGADQYQVQWSKTKYPWRKEGEKLTYATSSLLAVTPGRWWYRVRGINFSLPGTARAMTWSAPVGLTVTKPTFAVVKKSGR
jgi:hypothetical protein